MPLLYNMRRLIVIYIFSLIFQNGYCKSRVDPLVETKLGLIKGLRANDGDYSMFMGIPYAHVNPSNPFADSIPEPPFEEVFEAFDDSAICPQVEEFNNTITGSLDCLHLNIYVPDSASSRNPLPVLVWIYGGGFRYGFSGRYLYGPSYLVRHDIILVTINYRVGPYGFMCLDTPDVPGNQGLKDQLLALRWIKEHIDAFGGNSNKITIFGESAGSMSVDFHVLSPQDENLFSQIIMQSGTTLTATFFEPFRDAPITLAEYLGYDTDDIDEAISFLATTEAKTVIAAVGATGLDFKPCLEKEFDNVDRIINRNWITADVPKIKKMPVLIGFNSQEMLTSYVFEGAEFYERTNPFHEKLKLGFDVDNDEFAGMEEMVRHFYIGEESLSEDAKWGIIDFESDYRFGHATYRTINKFIENGAGNIYSYMFSYNGERNFVKKRNNITIGGAAHADEISYMFDVSIFDRNLSPEDQLVVDRITTLWANFVKYGDPTPELSELLPTKWIPITQGSSYHYLDIGSELSAKTRPYSSRLTFWELFYKLNWHLQWIYPGESVV